MSAKNLFALNLNVDRDRLLLEASDRADFKPFVDPLSGTELEKWSIKRISSGYAFDLSSKFKDLIGSTNCRPRFYIQSQGFSIPFHKDRSTLCSLNIVLSGQSDPISFRDEQILYDMALLNTQAEHAVLEPKQTRILYKISVFDKTYDEVLSIVSTWHRDVLISK